jgi:hypothetical protein
MLDQEACESLEYGGRRRGGYQRCCPGRSNKDHQWYRAAFHFHGSADGTSFDEATNFQAAGTSLWEYQRHASLHESSSTEWMSSWNLRGTLDGHIVFSFYNRSRPWLLILSKLQPSISFDNSGTTNNPNHLPQVITPVGRCITNIVDNSNKASQKKPVVTPAQEEDTARITRSTVSNTNGSTSESSKAASHQVEPSHLLATLPLLGGQTLRVVCYDLLKKARPGNYKPNLPSFGTLVHKMVSEAAATNPDIIRWVCDGEAFIVNHDHPGIGNVLSKFFQREF